MGNQFTPISCEEYYKPSRQGAEGCDAWAPRQVKYRAQLRRLFVRHWQLAPEVSFENYASRAYADALTYAPNREAGELSKLEPRGRPLMHAFQSAEFARFEIFVKWSDFPPTDTLNLSRIFLAVEFCADGKCSSTAPKRVNGRVATFNQLNLSRPRVSTLTPCSYPLEDFDLYDRRFPAWYFLDSAGQVKEIFSLQNRVAGYQYDPESLSPIPVWKRHFSKSLGPTDIVCGPVIRYSSTDRTYKFDHPIVEEAGSYRLKHHGVLDEAQVSVRAMADGYLLKSGPTLGTHSPLGTGACGACPTQEITIYHLQPARGISLAFDRKLSMNSRDTDGDIQLSEDWQTVTVYTAQHDSNHKEVWKSERYCLSGQRYEKCGAGPPGAPPNPRHIPWKE